LIESELFGYEEGAFTGARRHGAKGLLREADGGILFLDEIGDMPLSMQTRLLRVLQEREVMPLGGGKPVKVEFSVIAATNRDVTSGSPEQIRPDLFFRIANYTVRLPALRELNNGSEMIRAMWQRLTRSNPIRLHADTQVLLAAYDWPGNLRQLNGVLRTLIALATDNCVVMPGDLPETIRQTHVRAASRPAANSPLADITKRAMRDALDAHDGNVSASAKSLGISRSTLYRRLS
jgi:transcriptional regulator of acetoin/glycerol metabolism